MACEAVARSLRLCSLLLLLTAAACCAQRPTICSRFPAPRARPRTRQADAAARSCASRRWRRAVRARCSRHSKPKGPRIVVFEVGGVIDMQQHEIKITKPFLTVAGQTAPSPGITLIRTGIDVTTHDVVAAAHPRAHRLGRCAEARRLGAGRVLDIGRRVQRDRRSLLDDLGDRREPVGLRPALHRQDAGGMAPRHFAPHHLQQQHHRRGAASLDAFQGRAFQGLADPRQRHATS